MTTSQRFKRRKIQIEPFTLVIWPEISLPVGPFVPIQPQPVQIFEQAGGILRPTAVRIKVFHPQHHRTTQFANIQPGQKRRPGVAEMHPA